MVIGLSLGLLGLLGVALGAKSLADSGVIGRASSSLSLKTSSDQIAENDRAFAEKYMSESVIDSSASPQPFISSPELTRPESVSGGSSGNDNRGKKDTWRKLKYSTLGGAVGYTASSVLEAADEVGDAIKSVDWSVVFLLGGAILVYKVLK